MTEDAAQAETESPQLGDETLDLLFELTRDAPQKQLDSVEALDGKVVQVFAAGSVVVGLTAMGNSLKTSMTTLPSGYFTAILIAIVAYFVLAASAAVALWVRQFFVSWGADITWRDYWWATPRSIKHSLVESVANDYRKNRSLLVRKRWLVRVAISALAIESLAVGSALLILLR